MQESIYDLWAKVCEHPDFAGGTFFDREDVARALYVEDWDEEATADDVAKVTEDDMRAARKAIESWMFADTAYSWTDAMQDYVSMERRERLE